MGGRSSTSTSNLHHEESAESSASQSSTCDTSSVLLAVSNLGTLVDGVERLEVEKLDTGTSTGEIIDGTGDTCVDSVLPVVLGTGGVGSEKDDERRRQTYR